MQALCYIYQMKTPVHRSRPGYSYQIKTPVHASRPCVTFHQIKTISKDHSCKNSSVQPLQTWLINYSMILRYNFTTKAPNIQNTNICRLCIYVDFIFHQHLFTHRKQINTNCHLNIKYVKWHFLTSSSNAQNKQTKQARTQSRENFKVRNTKSQLKRNQFFGAFLSF